MRRPIFAAFAIALALPAAAAGFKDCLQFFPKNSPPKVPDAAARQVREICYDAFAILHSGATKTPVFVAEKLNRAHLIDAGDEERTNRFFADARLPSREKATLDDYKGSGYDRGHMAPAADMPTAAAMAQSFSLANMVPQAPKNNRGAWANIEKGTRSYAMRAGGDVYVISGPVYGPKPEKIGSGVAVPAYLFKLVYDAKTGKSWAHWIENSDDARPGPPISYEELVKRTGIRFLE